MTVFSSGVLGCCRFPALLRGFCGRLNHDKSQRTTECIMHFNVPIIKIDIPLQLLPED